MDHRPQFESAPNPPPAIDCDRALRLVDAQSTTSLPTHLSEILRGHLAVCPECKSAYRERMQSVAALGRQLRASAGGSSARLGPNHFSRRVGSRSIRRFAMFVVPAALFFLASQLDASWNFEPPLTVHAIEGTAWIGGRPLEPEGGELRLRRSDLVETPPDARCRIVARSFEVAVEPQARVLVISALARRVRLEEGQVDVSGEVTLETPLGLVEVAAGEARVRLDAGGLVVEARSGTVRRIDARGARVVAPAAIQFAGS